MERANVVIVPSIEAQRARKLLETAGVRDRTRKLQRLSSGNVAIPVTADSIADGLGATDSDASVLGQCKVTQMELPPSKAGSLETPAAVLRRGIREMLQGKVGGDQLRELMEEVPRHWERHGDLVLLPESSFRSPVWQQQLPEVWSCVVRSLGCARLARRRRVSANGFRSPSVDLLLGDSGWVEQTDNQIRYTFDVTKCMSSAGNITEKLRVASFLCQGETVLDLYAGIGYFTLPYLLHAGAAHVHACEWNPDAVKALKHNLLINGVADRCTVHAGDNRQLGLVSAVDRVNLGLIPSSEAGWDVACQALRRDWGGMLHIHGNVSSRTLPSPSTSTPANTSTQGLHCEVGAWQADAVESRYGGLASVLAPHGSVGGERLATCDKGSNVSSYSACKGCGVASRKKTSRGIGPSDDRTEVHADGSVAHANCQDVRCSTSSSSLDISELKLPEACEADLCIATFTHKTEPKDVKPEHKTHCECDQRLQRNIPLQTEPCDSDDITVSPLSCVLATNTQEVICSQDKHSTDVLSKSSKDLGPVAWGHGMKGREGATWRHCGQLWADSVAARIKAILEKNHGGLWATRVQHIEHVKSYAPHVHHLVVDLECRPLGED